jgi:5S rRNA maturation endonuclease (ribonuclease M5)
LGCSEAGYIAINMAGPGRRYQDFVEFLVDFIKELNDLSEDGGVVLVEGKRDATALSGLGYAGPLVTKAMPDSQRRLLAKAKVVVILTDLDREGRKLAASYIKFFARQGIPTSLSHRRRLSHASRGRFLHVENLIRFVPLVPPIDAIVAESKGLNKGEIRCDPVRLSSVNKLTRVKNAIARFGYSKVPR